MAFKNAMSFFADAIKYISRDFDTALGPVLNINSNQLGLPLVVFENPVQATKVKHQPHHLSSLSVASPHPAPTHYVMIL